MGFDMFGTNYTLQDVEGPLDYREIKVGVKNLDDAVLNLGSYNANLPKYNGISKGMVMRALADNDLPELRRISNLFYSVMLFCTSTLSTLTGYDPANLRISFSFIAIFFSRSGIKVAVIAYSSCAC